jgi:hypothetical protein
VVSAVTSRHHKSIFENIKKHRGAPGEHDPLLGLLDKQAVDEVRCRSASRHWSAVVGGESQRLLDDIAEPSRHHRASGHALLSSLGPRPAVAPRTTPRRRAAVEKEKGGRLGAITVK